MLAGHKEAGLPNRRVDGIVAPLLCGSPMRSAAGGRVLLLTVLVVRRVVGEDDRVAILTNDELCRVEHAKN